MVFMFLGGRILGGKHVLLAPRKQWYWIYLFCLVCIVQYTLVLRYLLLSSCHLHKGLWFRITVLDPVCNTLSISILCYLKSLPKVFRSEVWSYSDIVGYIMLSSQLPHPSDVAFLVLPVVQVMPWMASGHHLSTINWASIGTFFFCCLQQLSCFCDDLSFFYIPSWEERVLQRKNSIIVPFSSG